MIRSWNTIPQAFIASLFTWGITALGAAVVFLIPPSSKKLLDISLGFAAGIMTAASFWSLLAPAIELAEAGIGSLAFIPVGIGFVAGAFFVYLADRIMPSCVFSEISVVDILTEDVSAVDQRSFSKLDAIVEENVCMMRLKESSNNATRYRSTTAKPTEQIIRRRTTENRSDNTNAGNSDAGTSDITSTTVIDNDKVNGNRATDKERALVAAISWRRILLLIVAVTVHNIPEGLAVGVAFGSIGKTAKATFESAFTLALGIGLQNFPEGLAVSLPLAAFGHSKIKSFFYGQLSGMVEPIAALAGSMAVILIEPILPYALSFAAGAMIYVVIDDIIPEAQRNGNGRLASLSSIAGFLIMMSLDVGLG
ncbi:unnamed protein product [Thelazia callipaeda]|uniref:Zinc transporter ZIP11 n=1 Tax=Thelazia callipaeda TaxID=103827 RepID=A0A0N5D6R1_THECL|nr:unnamed protein product [Thelazia callipaeda]